MLAKNITAITADDINALIDNEVRENRCFEYKQTLPGNSDPDKKEFLADITSFANAGGGDIIYGIKEEKGVAVEALGLVDFNEDKDRLRLENIIRNGAEPRVSGVQMQAVARFVKGPILVVRVPRSWAGPHMVTHGGSSRFYSRSSNAKFPMDVAQIRAAFDGSTELPQRIARWRDERLGRIVANEGPVRLNSNACLVVHLVPLESFSDQWRFHVSDINDPFTPFAPIASNGPDRRVNLDGVVTFEGSEVSSKYTQMFRSGRVESVFTSVIHESNGRRQVYAIQYEQEVIKSVCGYLKGLNKLDVQLPIVFLLSLTGVKGAYLPTDRYMSLDLSPVDRDMIQCPDVLIESYGCDLPQVLRPAFDSIRNACGLP